MKERSHFLKSLSGVSLHYKVFGEGKPVLAFHGYGMSHYQFKVLAEALPEYAFYSFDLFFHGKSIWDRGEDPLSKETWSTILNDFLNCEKIEKFSVAGFSLGGKFALASLEIFPDKIDKLILIAPDGIKTNFWYSLATFPIGLRKVFRSLIYRPEPFYSSINALHKLRVVDKGLVKFSKSQMQSHEQRKRVYYSWVVFRKLQFDQKKIAFLINQYDIPTEVYLGKFDKIITPKNVRPFLDLINRCSIEVLEAGHNHLVKDTATLISSRKGISVSSTH